MAIAVENLGTDSSSVGEQTFTFDYGFSPTEDNLLIAFISTRSGTVSPNTPSGWTKAFGLADTSSINYTSCFYKEAAAAEPTSQDFTISDFWKWAGGIYEISGHNSAAIMNATPVTDTPAATTSPTSLSITTDVDGCLIIAGFGCYNLTTVAAESGLTNKWAELSSGGSTTNNSGGSEIQSSSGGTGTYVHSNSDSLVPVTFTVAIAPAAPAANSSQLIYTKYS